MSRYKIKCIRVLYMVRGSAYFPKIGKLSTCMPWKKSYWLICLENLLNLYHNKFLTLGNRENLDLQSVGSAAKKCAGMIVQLGYRASTSADPGRDRGPDPPGKSQVIWVSIGNKPLDSPSWKKLGPLPGKSWTRMDNVGPPSEPEKATLSELFCQIDLDPPDENSWIRACSPSSLVVRGMYSSFWFETINLGWPILYI